jgi:predicted  nucleic acid-binding Zn-ribbon protein
MAVFGALGRYVRAFGYLITGRIDSARKELSKNPHVIQATYDRIVQEKTAQIGHYKDAVAAMIAQQEKKMATLKRLSDETSKLEQLKQGAAAKAKSVVDRLKGQGMDMEAIKHNEDYMKCLAAYNDFSSTLQEKASRIGELEADVAALGDNISGHKVQLQQLLRDLDGLREEAAATVADMITAKEEENIANMVAGISQERFSKELQDMRDLRQQSKAKARISREMAGTDTKRQESEFLEYARAGASTDEFDRLIGLAGEADKSASDDGATREAAQKSKLPEQ